MEGCSDLLVLDFERGDGWPELCAFLGEPVPDTPFPHVNRGVYTAVVADVTRTPGAANVAPHIHMVGESDAPA
ncbi:MAG: hypothetical protein F4Y26_16720 [Gammaproteobacteria bacterium]|nr:hypothetical protein [Gammaproteobacteria bacterium]